MPDDKRLDRALVSGIAWTAVLRWGAQLASWIATAFAARLLTPGDYGIIAMATIGIGLLRMVEDFGLDAILVQDRSIAGVQQARLAGLVVAIGVTFCAVFLALAQPIAIFFREPQVAWAVAGLSVLCVTDALQVVPRAMLQRQLEFRRFAMIAPVQVLATQSVLLVAAASGWGFWALITSSIAGAVAVTAVLVVWRPYAVAWPGYARQSPAPRLARSRGADRILRAELCRSDDHRPRPRQGRPRGILLRDRICECAVARSDVDR